MHLETIIQERDSTGGEREIRVTEEGLKIACGGKGFSSEPRPRIGRSPLVNLLTKVFLPAGYPDTVSPDYLRYQILNGLQAFCNSLATLLSSRAVLQGFGVGDPTATPTSAVLLTVVQDVFSRLTTILSAYWIGSSLYPEAKTYRLLADVVNDISLVLDTMSPFLHSLSVPGLRISALSLSAAFKSLCAITAGGAKAAITLHFATPVTGKGDLGDLNAKDASKETVLALLGMLLGTLIVPRLTSAWATYSALFTLTGLHLLINYFGVKGIVLRTLNRQRASLAWVIYRRSDTFPSPSEVVQYERIFERPGIIRDIITGNTLGHCAIGSSLSEILRHPIPPQLFHVFEKEQYLIWFDSCCLHQIQETASVSRGPLRLHICLKDGNTVRDQLKAWLHAVELCLHMRVSSHPAKDVDAFEVLRASHDKVTSSFDDVLQKMEDSGWNVDDCALLTGSPKALLLNVASSTGKIDDRKSQ